MFMSNEKNKIDDQRKTIVNDSDKLRNDYEKRSRRVNITLQ